MFAFDCENDRMRVFDFSVKWGGTRPPEPPFRCALSLSQLLSLPPPRPAEPAPRFASASSKMAEVETSTRSTWSRRGRVRRGLRPQVERARGCRRMRA
eukprot:984082-Rhodomonas_salina.1